MTLSVLKESKITHDKWNQNEGLCFPVITLDRIIRNLQSPNDGKPVHGGLM